MTLPSLGQIAVFALTLGTCLGGLEIVDRWRRR